MTLLVNRGLVGGRLVNGGILGGSAGGGLLLDLVPGAAAAYSLRLLRTAYAGSAIRVRRSSDNAETDIGFSAGVLDTSALLTFCGAGDGFAATWYDQSGNARNATQATAGNQPQIVASGSVLVNAAGKPVPTWSGSQRVLANFGATLSQPNFITHVLQRSVSDSTYVYDGITSTNRHSFIGAGTDEDAFAGTAAALATRDTDAHIWSVLFNDTSSAAWRDGAAVGTLSLGTQSLTGLSLGSRYNFQSPFSGWMAEVVIWNTDQTASRATLEANINTFYSIF